jgi:MFS family permease
MGALAIFSSTMSKNPVLPLFAKFLGAEGALLGLIAAASTIPGILVSLPAGSLSDLYGRRRVVILSLLVFASAPFFYLLVAAPWQLMLVRFYHGFATAIFGPVANAIIAERYPNRKGERISLFSSATLVGRSAAPFVGGFILLLSNYSSLYLAVGASAICSLLVGLLLFRGWSSVEGEALTGGNSGISILDSLGSITTNSKILVTSFVEATQFFTFGAFEFFLVLYADSVGLGILGIGVMSGAQLVAVGITKPIFGSLSDRIGRKPMIIGGLLLGSLSLLVISSLTGFVPIVAMGIVYGLGFSAVTSSTTPYVTDLVGEESYGCAMGFISTIMDVGQTIGPIVTGIMVASFSYSPSFIFLGLVLLASCIIFITVAGLGRDRDD